jgi:serpin B
VFATQHRLSVAALLLIAACSSDAGQPSGEPDDGAGEEQTAAPAGAELARSKLSRVQPSSDHLTALAAGNATFAFDVFQQLAARAPAESFVFSPYSLSSALAMTYAGAVGQTAQEIQQTLHFELGHPQLDEAFNAAELALRSRGQGKRGVEDAPFRLQVVNAMWTQKGAEIVPAFLDTLASHYGAGVYLLDFKDQPEPSRAAINGWVAQQTEQRISELLTSDNITPLTRVVLTNALYFNASWLTPFKPESTNAAAFYKLDGQTVQVPMMRSRLTAPYAKGEGYEAVALPYASPELALIAVLPDRDAYESIEQAANASWFAQVRAELASAGLQLSLPKFETRTPTSAKETLKALGMQVPFTTQADFSNMTSLDVFISDVVHEAVVTVTESGTVATAATAVVLARKGESVVDHTVAFDRPFLYAIVDQPTGQILFLGRVLEPGTLE